MKKKQIKFAFHNRIHWPVVILIPDFCKKISEKTRRRLAGENESDSEEEVQLRMNSDDEDAPFIHHPFRVSEKAEIVMNIRVFHDKNLFQLVTVDTLSEQVTP